jgi:hypothetical protein
VDTSDQRLIHVPDYCYTKLLKACNYEWGLCIMANTGSSGPAPIGVTCYYQYLFFVKTTTYRDTGPGGPPSTSSSTLVVAAVGHSASTPRGPPSTSSSTSVVVAARDTDSTPQGVRHRRLLQLWWWLLLNFGQHPPREPAIAFFNFCGGCCQRY